MDVNPANSTKQRAMRIPLAYTRRRDRLVRAKWLWAGLATLIAAAGAAFVSVDLSDHLPVPRGAQLASHGPISAAHASFEADCAACHAAWSLDSPISSGAWGHETAAASGEKWGRAVDQKCRDCHAGEIAAVEHHANERLAEVVACAACHQEHRGREVSLARIEDRHCTSCHEKLDDHVEPVPQDIDREFRFAAVTRFDQQHPEFASLQRDPGNVKFNHKLHLLTGLRNGDSAPWTWERFSPADRERYGNLLGAKSPRAADWVQLDCGACHQPDSSAVDPLAATAEELAEKGVPGSLLASRGDGRDMRPIVYEVHCQACHPLNYEPGGQQHVVPHRLAPDRMRNLLTWELGKPYLKEDGSGDGSRAGEPKPGTASRNESEAAKQRVEPTPLPHKPAALTDPRVLAEIDAKVAKAEAELGRRCAVCHAEPERPGALILAPSPTGLPGPPTTVLMPEVRAKIPRVWLKSANFHHAKHAGINCADCHGGAEASTRAEDALFGTARRDGRSQVNELRAKCAECHRGPQAGAAAGAAQARFDCVQCHTYHGGQTPRHGSGAPFRLQTPIAGESQPGESQPRRG